MKKEKNIRADEWLEQQYQHRTGYAHRCLIVVFTFLILAMAAMPAYAVEFTSTDCRDSKLCTLTTECDLSGCREASRDCRDCGSNRVFCPDGSVASCMNRCEKSVSGAACASCHPTCPAASSNVLVLLFDVFVSRNMNVTIAPEIQGGLPGTALSYNVIITNMNPVEVLVAAQLQLPAGWSSS